MDESFKKGEIVWAKVRGYSWWPGIIKKITLKFSKTDNPTDSLLTKNLGSSREIRVLVKFIGDNSHSVLPIDKIEKFEKKYSQFSKTKQKPLQNSIRLAKKMLSGEISLLELNKSITSNISNKSISPDIVDFSDEDSSKEKDNVKFFIFSYLNKNNI